MSDNNEAIIAAGTYHSDKFESVNQDLRQHINLAKREIDKVKEKVNELVVIVHNDNKDWSVKKICDYIAGRNDDLEEFGFSSRTIYNYLSYENRQLLDKTKQNRNNFLEQSVESLQHKDPEQSSITPEEEIAKLQEANEKLQQEIDQLQQQQQQTLQLEDGASDKTETEELHDLPKPIQELEEEKTKEEPTEIIYDKDLLNKHVKQIAKLQEENAKLNIDRIPTRANKFDFRYEIELNDEMLQLLKANSGICPLIGTAFRDKDDGYIRFDREKIERDIKVAQKKK